MNHPKPPPPAPAAAAAHHAHWMGVHVQWIVNTLGVGSAAEIAAQLLQTLASMAPAAGAPPLPAGLVKLRDCAASAWNAWQATATSGVVLAPADALNGAKKLRGL